MDLDGLDDEEREGRSGRVKGGREVVKLKENEFCFRGFGVVKETVLFSFCAGRFSSRWCE